MRERTKKRAHFYNPKLTASSTIKGAHDFPEVTTTNRDRRIALLISKEETAVATQFSSMLGSPREWSVAN